MSNPIQSSIQLAARLTDSLYRENIVSSDSAQALFDVLCDALASRPDVVAAVAEELSDRDEQSRKYYAEITERLMNLEQHISEGHNVD
jgi:hypothetical protein